MSQNQKNSYKRYPNEYSGAYNAYVDGNTVRKTEDSNDLTLQKRQAQKRRKIQQEEILRKKRERAEQERAKTFDFSFTFFVIFVVAIMVVLGIAAIKPISDSMKLKLEIKTLTAEVLEAKKANDEFEIDMNNKIDLDYVRLVAKSAGLSYPKSGQKIYAKTTDSDYCVLLMPID